MVSTDDLLDSSIGPKGELSLIVANPTRNLIFRRYEFVRTSDSGSILKVYLKKEPSVSMPDPLQIYIRIKGELHPVSEVEISLYEEGN